MSETSTSQNSDQKSPEFGFLEPIKWPELVFALVGPIGTDMSLVSAVLSATLNHVGYQTKEIKVTDLLSEFEDDFGLVESPLEKRYEAYISAGNLIREKTKRNDVFALLSIAAIRNQREFLTGSRDEPSPKTAYILNQFKRPEEISTLRSIYGDGLIQVSAFCTKEIHLQSLTKRIAASHYRKLPDTAYSGKAHDLIFKDDAEEENKYGQRVRDTFPLADVIIKADSKIHIEKTCERFIRAFFGDNFVTPSFDEYGSFLAKSVSLRSSDLSRQVGAAIMSPKGEIISMGCNEVPKATGGTYWEGDPHDTRDFKIGHDSSVKVKNEILQDTFRRLKETWFNEEKSKKDISELVHEALHVGDPPIMKDSNLMDILEFGRIIHAEMSALCDAARLGIQTKGATLYCTTFPCHMCARHIIAAGISRVVYVEPYSKSLAAELYEDSIHVEGGPNHHFPVVNFDPFIGIAPQRYTSIFTKGKRKDNSGRASQWNPKEATPMIKRLVPEYLPIEAAVVNSFEDLVQRAGLHLKQ